MSTFSSRLSMSLAAAVVTTAALGAAPWPAAPAVAPNAARPNPCPNAAPPPSAVPARPSAAPAKRNKPRVLRPIPRGPSAVPGIPSPRPHVRIPCFAPPLALDLAGRTQHRPPPRPVQRGRVRAGDHRVGLAAAELGAGRPGGGVRTLPAGGRDRSAQRRPVLLPRPPQPRRRARPPACVLACHRVGPPPSAHAGPHGVETHRPHPPAGHRARRPGPAREPLHHQPMGHRRSLVRRGAHAGLPGPLQPRPGDRA